MPADEAIAARVIARLDDFAPSAIHELGPDAAPLWRVFFASVATRDEAVGALAGEFVGDGVTCTAVNVPDEDWAARSQASLGAVRVGRIVVAPPWNVDADPAPGAGLPASGLEAEILVVIRPSMGFGTGHHETTRLCLRLLQESRVGGCDVLDVGTGSGVLAIASALLGARSVRAIDVDEDALESARENVALNIDALAAAGVLPVVAAGNLRDGVGPADLVIANLTGGLLIAAAAPLAAAVRPGGQLLVSGFQPPEADAVLAALAPSGALVDRRREGDWEAALIGR
jgi:ribosomal protein L11 methyltransferase